MKVSQLFRKKTDYDTVAQLDGISYLAQLQAATRARSEHMRWYE